MPKDKGRKNWPILEAAQFPNEKVLWVDAINTFQPFTQEEEDALRECVLSGSDPRELSVWYAVSRMFCQDAEVPYLLDHSRRIILNVLGRKGGPVQ